MLTSFTFMFVLLPLALAIFYMLPGRYRSAALLAFSLLLYAQGHVRGMLMMLICVLTDYAAARVMGREGALHATRRACLVFTVSKNVIMVAYVGAILESSLAGNSFGLLVYALSGIDYVLSVYRREIPAEKNVLYVLLYCCFFPRLFAGPLLLYKDFRSQLHTMALAPEKLVQGLGRFVQGAFKYGILGLMIGNISDTLRLFPTADATVLSSWMFMLALALSLYYSLSGLCDMAQGIGLAFGIALPNNFYYPYQSLSAEDFLTRFNMTVYYFIRRTVYAGLQEDRNGILSDCLNILVSGMLMGLWFGFQMNYMLWGMFLAVFIILEKYAYPRLLRGMPTLFSRLYALGVVLLSFTIFAGESLPQSAGYLCAMLGLGGLGGANPKILYLLSSNWLVLLVGVFFAFSIASKLLQILRGAFPRVSFSLQCAADAGLLVLFTALHI